MTSKEALEKFKLLYESKCKSSNNIIGFDMCYTTIKQDLERLEILEKFIEILKDKLEVHTYYLSFLDEGLSRAEHELFEEVLNND